MVARYHLLLLNQSVAPLGCNRIWSTWGLNFQPEYYTLFFVGILPKRKSMQLSAFLLLEKYLFWDIGNWLNSSVQLLRYLSAGGLSYWYCYLTAELGSANFNLPIDDYSFMLRFGTYFGIQHFETSSSSSILNQTLSILCAILDILICKIVRSQIWRQITRRRFCPLSGKMCLK